MRAFCTYTACLPYVHVISSTNMSTNCHLSCERYITLKAVIVIPDRHIKLQEPFHSLTRGRATHVSLTPLSTPGVQESCTQYKNAREIILISVSFMLYG